MGELTRTTPSMTAPAALRTGVGRRAPGEQRPHVALSAAKKRPLEAVIKVVLRVAAGITVVITLGIVIALIVPSIGFFAEVSPIEFLFGTRWAPRFADASFGVIPLITATLWTTVIALITAVPLGLGAAVFLSEYAPPRLRAILKPVLEILAGVPTVVYGLFALQFVQGTLFRDILHLPTGSFSVLAAGLVMGI